MVCEGRKTEPAYFAALKRARTSALIEVKVVAGAGVPMTVAQQAVDLVAPRRRRYRDSFEEGDQVWAVFDRDEHHCFDEAVRLCERNGVRVARSNPCFELWLILHKDDYDRDSKSRVVQRKAASLFPEYDKDGAKTPNCDELMRHVEEAERRANAQLQRRAAEGAPHGNPSTTAGRLTRAIHEADAAARPRD